MAENEKNTDFAASSDAASESAEEILAGIIGKDGTFNEEFNGLFERYLGSNFVEPVRSVQTPAVPAQTVKTTTGVRDYSNEIGERVEYESPEYVSQQGKTHQDSFEEKLPVNVRSVYSNMASQAQNPEFTSQGTVKYPTMGVGEAEERVVFDADWEEKAKKEAARLERVRQDNMLRGDSAYARSFYSGGVPMSSRVPTVQKRPNINPAYIDPLSDDTDGNISFAKPVINEEKEKKSFFQEGFSEKTVKNNVAGGKTKKSLSDNNDTKTNDENSSVTVDEAVLDAFAVSLDESVSYRKRFASDFEKAKIRLEQDEKKLQESEMQTEKKKHKTSDSQKKEESETLKISKFPQKSNSDNQENNINSFDDKTASFTIDGVKVTQAELDDLAKLAGEDDGFENFSDEIRSPEVEFADLPVKESRKIKKNIFQRIEFFLKTRFSKENIQKFMYNNLPNKDDSTGEKIRKIIRDIAFVALICALIYLAIYGCNYLERRWQSSKFEELVNEYEEMPESEIEDEWANIKALYPDVDFPEGMNIKFASLYAINQDVVGWLTIPNTNISTVLLQGNYDGYYLYKNIYKKYSRYGNPYVDVDCNMNAGSLSRNTIIYGHNTHDGLMFHQLTNYMTVDGYKKAPVVTLETLYETTKWKIFAVILTNSTPEADNGNVFRYLYSDFSSDAAFMSKIDEIYERSMIHTGVDVNEEDKILTLYTCYQNIFSGGRLAIFARQVRDGESEEVDLSKVYYDSTARFPQAYYDKKGLTNPYK